MKKYEDSAKLFLFAVLGLLFLMIFLVCTNAKSQSIGIGLGVTSEGNTASYFKITDIHNIGAYAKFVNQELDSPDNCGYAGLVGTCSDEFTIGFNYRIHPQVILMAGSGVGKYETYNNPEDMHRDYTLTKQTIIEAGFSYDLIQRTYFTLSVDATLNSFSGVTTIVNILYNINPPKL